MTDPHTHSGPGSSTTTGKAAPPARSTKETVRMVAAIVLGGLVIAFAVLNRKKVSVNWILGTWSTPLIIVIAITFLLGVAAGFLVRGRHAKAKQRKHDQKKR
jgi:uncharacterized integral membrane protein